MNTPVTSLEQIKHTVIDLAIRFGPRVLVAMLILFVGLTASRWVSRWLARGLSRIELEPPVRALLARIGWLLTFTLFMIMALQNLGVELLPLVAGVGVAGAGLALATQGVLGNLVAGLSIIFAKPFRVGEYISIAGEEGQVATITLFTTTLAHPDRSRVVIPNRKIVGEILHNFGTVRQIDIVVGVAYDTDINSAVAAIDDVLQANSRVLRDPAPVVQPVFLGDSSVSIGIRPWVGVADYRATVGEINEAVLKMFRNRGIVIPFPQREVRLVGGT
ncbi:MAG TPA: mechanosensitive ion channel domain-containing protein [Steroidobacteraceae bacterium]|jgi:small conductance mechanosensitive channel|nr:mechanosensitive ion channel domain-containing protein [Steroidobacteraceae bacterium]